MVSEVKPNGQPKKGYRVISEFQYAPGSAFGGVWLGGLSFSQRRRKAVNPSLAKQWHPTKNGSLTPIEVTPGNGKKVWWKCTEGHEWVAVVKRRNAGRGCLYCTGRSLGKDYTLERAYPKVATQSHASKNGSLTPRDVTSGSAKVVWWICGNGHEWKAQINGRNRGSGCPYCSGLKK